MTCQHVSQIVARPESPACGKGRWGRRSKHKFFPPSTKSVTSHKTLTRVSAGPQHELDGFAGLSPARPGPEKGEGRIAKTTIVFRKPGPSTCDHDATTIQTPKKTQELKQGNCSWPGYTATKTNESMDTARLKEQMHANNNMNASGL